MLNLYLQKAAAIILEHNNTKDSAEIIRIFTSILLLNRSASDGPLTEEDLTPFRQYREQMRRWSHLRYHSPFTHLKGFLRLTMAALGLATFVIRRTFTNAHIPSFTHITKFMVLGLIGFWSLSKLLDLLPWVYTAKDVNQQLMLGGRGLEHLMRGYIRTAHGQCFFKAANGCFGMTPVDARTGDEVHFVIVTRLR